MTTSRRALLEGTAWAAPAVLATAAIPAYAASTPITSGVAQGSVDSFGFQSVDSTDLVNFTGQTTQSPMTDGSTGFRLYQTTGADTTAVLTALTYYVLIPRNDAYTIDSVNINYGPVATVWDPMALSAQATVALSNGNVLSSADYLIYAATYKAGPTTITVGPETTSQAVSGTDISTNIAGKFTDGGNAMIPSEIAGLYTGYIATYSVNGVASTTSSTVAPSTKTS